MSYAIEAKRALSELGTKAQNVLKDASLTNAEKKIQLDKLQAEAKQHQNSLALGQRAGLLMSGGSSLETPGADLKTFGVAAKGAAVPALTLDDSVLHEAYLRVKGGGNFRAELGMKDAASSSTTVGQMPNQLVGLVSRTHESLRILDHIPTSPTEAPSIEYIAHTSSTGGAGSVSAGATMTEVILNTTTIIAKLEKLGIFTTLTDEIVADYSAFRSYVEVELTRLIVDAENAQLIGGNGTSPQIRGILSASGTLTRVKAASPETQIDTLNLAINDLRTGPSFIEPDLFIVNPTTWTGIRGLKNSYGEYLLGDPGQTPVNELWGVPVVTTTQITAGTGILMNAAAACTAWIRQGITLEMTNSSGADFESGRVKVRATERLTLGIQRPSAINVVTGL